MAGRRAAMSCTASRSAASEPRRLSPAEKLTTEGFLVDAPTKIKWSQVYDKKLKCSASFKTQEWHCVSQDMGDDISFVVTLRPNITT